MSIIIVLCAGIAAFVRYFNVVGPERSIGHAVARVQRQHQTTAGVTPARIPKEYIEGY